MMHALQQLDGRKSRVGGVQPMTFVAAPKTMTAMPSRSRRDGHRR